MTLRQVVLWGCAAGALALVAFFLFFRGSGASPGTAQPDMGVSRSVATEPNAQTAPMAAAGAVVEKPAGQIVQNPPESLKAKLDRSRDFLAFAASILEDAKAGDANAQYYLAYSLQYCDFFYDFYFVRGNKRRTLDEAMQWASTRVGLSADEARLVHERCHELRSMDPPPFGGFDQWLNVAAASGHPLARIHLANELSAKVGVSGTPEDIKNKQEAKELTLQALRSKDPEVIFQAADLAMLFLGDDVKADEAQWVWRVAACKRGLDCGPNSDWIKMACKYDYNCQPQDNVLDLIRRYNSQRYDTIDRKANELNEKLDANKFDSLF